MTDIVECERINWNAKPALRAYLDEIISLEYSVSDYKNHYKNSLYCAKNKRFSTQHSFIDLFKISASTYQTKITSTKIILSKIHILPVNKVNPNSNSYVYLAEINEYIGKFNRKHTIAQLDSLIEEYNDFAKTVAEFVHKFIFTHFDTKPVQIRRSSPQTTSVVNMDIDDLAKAFGRTLQRSPDTSPSKTAKISRIKGGNSKK